VIAGLLRVAASALEMGQSLAWRRRPRPWRQATGWDRLAGAPTPCSRLPLGDSTEPAELHWLGHAGFLLRWRGTTLLVDPHTGRRCGRAGRCLEASLPAAALPAVDAVLVTQAGAAHLDRPTLAALSRVGAYVVPVGCEGHLAGLKRSGSAVVVLPEGLDATADGGGQTAIACALRVGGLEVIAVPAAPAASADRSVPPGDRRVGYIVRAIDSPGSHPPAIYVAGDAGWGPHLAAIARCFRPTAALLPIGSRLPRWATAGGGLGPERAVDVALELNAPLVVPCRFATFALPLEEPSSALQRFSRAAAVAGVDWAMPVLLTDRAQLTPAESSRPVAAHGQAA
jgi:L-ascorbate metabolism protein UlaG (beta-lactamase superfamily)